MHKETSVPAAPAGRGLGWGLGVRLGLDSGSRESVELAIQKEIQKFASERMVTVSKKDK